MFTYEEERLIARALLAAKTEWLANRKIVAIKVFRDVTNFGLKNAKDICEAAFDRSQDKPITETDIIRQLNHVEKQYAAAQAEIRRLQDTLAQTNGANILNAEALKGAQLKIKKLEENEATLTKKEATAIDQRNKLTDLLALRDKEIAILRRK